MSSNSYFKKFLKGTEGPVADAGSTDQALQGAKENLLQSSEAVVGAVNALKGLADGSVSPIEAALDIKTAIDAVQGLSRQLSESLIMPLMTHLAAFKGEAFLPVAKQLDPVMGIDVHFVTVPPGTPVPLPHPYISVLFRAKDWVSCMVNMVKAEAMSAVQKAQPNANELHTEAEQAAQAKTDKLINQADGLVSTALGMAGLSATVLIGGVLPRAITGTPSRVIPHIPMGAGFHPSFDNTIAKDNGRVYLGSLFVTADGDPMAGMMHLNYDCWDIGIVDLFKSQRNSTKKSPDPENPKTELFVPSGSILPIPWGRPILINSVPTPVSPLSTGDKLFKAGLSKLKNHRLIAKYRDKFKERLNDFACAKRIPLSNKTILDLMGRQERYDDKGSKIMSVKEFKQFKKKMKEIGVEVVLDTKEKVLTQPSQLAAYDPSKKIIYLRKPPKVYDALHESFHAKQHNELGDKAYNEQTRLEKETYVYKQIMKNKDSLSDKNINHAQGYLYSVKYGSYPKDKDKNNMYIIDKEL